MTFGVLSSFADKAEYSVSVDSIEVVERSGGGTFSSFLDSSVLVLAVVRLSLWNLGL